MGNGPGAVPSFSWRLLVVVTGTVLAASGLVAFNFGYVGLYGAFVPLLCAGLLLVVEVGEDLFLSLLFLAAASALLYAVGLFALFLIVLSCLVTVPLALLLRYWGVGVIPAAIRDDAAPVFRGVEFATIVLVALGARYVLFRSGGGQFPLQIGELATLSHFILSEVGGWVVFALGYGMQHRRQYGVLYTPGLDFGSSLVALLATGLFLVSPHVAIMTLGLNTFGTTGLYLGAVPVAAAHLLLWTLTVRRLEITKQNVILQQMNTDLARNERLAAIGQMSSAISHQMLQKVGLLGLQCDLLRESLGDDAAAVTQRVDEAKERVAQIDETITDLNTTLADLLIFSRDFVLHREPCVITDIVSDVLQELAPMAAARTVAAQLTGDGTPIRLAVDRIKLKQALLNLVKNAIEASPACGDVAVTLTDSTHAVTVAVSDNGEGIPAAQFARLFSPFFSTKEKGTGLGLTFAQKIVELHQGTITVTKNADQGVTFTMILPRDSVKKGGDHAGA